MRTLFWFRQDLRLTDNTGLYHAAHNADDGLLLVYVICLDDFIQHHVSGCQIDFILRNLADLRESLQKHDLNLEVLTVQSRNEIATAILELMQAHDIDTLVANKQYEINENQRDISVKERLNQHNLKFARYEDQCIIPPGDVLKDDGTPYTVFTPFKKRWVTQLNEGAYLSRYDLPKHIKPIPTKVRAIPSKLDGIDLVDLSKHWPAGEKAAQARLNDFLEDRIKDYKDDRDFPALDGTSMLSPYLACGVISPRLCFDKAKEQNQNHILSGSHGIATWLSEMIWREFYKHILVHFPRVCRNRAFKTETDNLQWDEDQDLFQAWCDGKTGYPLVDAAMRQLNETGWMHNRLRMLVAMFLTKDCLLDWRLGERYFSEHLIDLDLSANNGGWQWAAGTGTDAAPYFRIFNPITQSEKFDAQGQFIKQYCPELKHLDAKSIHFPSDEQREKCNYPKPVVDHKIARQTFLERYKRDVKND